MLYIYLLSALVGMVLAQDTFNCAKFWPSLTPGESETIDDDCKYFPEYPIQIGPTKVTVVYTVEWEEAYAANIPVIQPILDRTLADTIDLYSGFMSLPSEVVIVLNDDDADVYTAATWNPVERAPPCQIQTWRRWTDNTANNEPRALQAIAHELYHCVQQLAIGHTGGWIAEGSASYFSNLVYPEANAEWPNAERNYNPLAPIYAQGGQDVYMTELFFQSLEQFSGIVGIHNWVMANLGTTPLSLYEERARLSQLAGFTDEFYEFSKQFSLKTIQDTSGTLIPGLIDITPIPAPVSTNGDGTIITATIKTIPFTMSVYQLDIDAGQTLAIYSNAKEYQRLAYRQAGDLTWSEMPSGPASGSDGTITTPCNDAGTPTSILVLFISSADSQDDDVDVTVQQMETDPNCECKQPMRRGLRRRGIQRRGIQDCHKPPGTCAGSSIPIDPCFTANTWNLDIPNTKALIISELASTPVTINSIDISGSGVLVFGQNTASYTYSDLVVTIDVSASGIELPVTTTINGQFDATLYTQSGGNGSGDYCLIVTSGSGTAKESDPFTGGFTLDLTPEGGFISQAYIFQYTCSAGRLTMEGTLNGVRKYGPYVYNSA
jgi:hypothetical protein